MPRRRPIHPLLAPLLSLLLLTTGSPAAAEPPAPEPVPSSTVAPEPAPTSAEPSRPTVPAPATSSMPTPEAARPTIPAPRPPPAERGRHLEPPGTVEEYDEALERLSWKVETTTGQRQKTAMADLAQVERWYDEDVYRNGGTLVAGIALLLASPAMLSGGVAAAFDGIVWPGGSSTSAAQIAAFPLLVGGLIALGGGIGLTVSGASRRIRTPSEREDWRARHPQRTSASPVTLTIGPGALTGAF